MRNSLHTAEAGIIYLGVPILTYFYFLSTFAMQEKKEVKAQTE